MGFLAGQSNFEAKPATGDTKFVGQNLLPAIQQAQGDYGSAQGRVGDVFGAQGQLANTLAAQAAGQGPNIAQLQLEQATNRNNQMGAGQIASTRGMNPALAARLIAQQTAANNQQAAGQSGLMRAQQQLSAQEQLANVYGQQGNLATAGGQLANQNLGQNQSALANQNQQVIGAQQAADKMNQETAQKNAAGLGGLLQGIAGGAATALAGPLGGLIGGKTGNFVSNLLNPPAKKYDGGEITGYSDGGKAIADSFKGASGSSGASSAMENLKKAIGLAEGGNVQDYRTEGGHVPGEPKHPGDDPRNDVVPAMLSKGEVVLPNTVTKSPDAPDKAKEFMEAILKEKQAGPKGFSKILEVKKKIKELHEHIGDMHDMLSDMK